MEPSRKKARKESSPSSASQQPGEDALQDILGLRSFALDLTLRCGYLCSDDMLRLYHTPLLASVFANLENWNGRTVVFELLTEDDLERLVYLCSRYLLFNRDFRPSQVSARIRLAKITAFTLSDRMLGRVAILGRFLQSLDLSGCEAITDGGVAHLAELKSLQKLSLRKCREITDGGVAHLAELKSLQSLDLSWCEAITDRGIEYLKKVIPNICVTFVR
jgi:hypothetical protein